MSGDDLGRAFPLMKDEKTGSVLWKDLRTLNLQYLLPISGVKKFFDGLRRNVLYGVKCRRCGARYFPPRARCSSCGSEDVEWVEVSKNGRLLSFTVVNVKPESFQKFPDYIVGLAEMDDGFRVLTWVKCDDHRKLRRNMRIKIEIGEREEDGVLTYFIVPAD